jgi:ubiquinone/menaquinone biosynthesis C-methylase UbiE
MGKSLGVRSEEKNGTLMGSMIMEGGSKETATVSPQRQLHDLEFWEKRAASFDQHSKKTHYSTEFMKLMELHPDWTVFDMACGGGTLALPLASKVKKITAVDFSPNMLAIVDRHCKEKNITNIRTILGQWDDDWESLKIEEHDITIASRSLRSENAAHYIHKLNQVARRCVYISAPVGSGPWDVRLLEFAGRELASGSDYIRFYNILYSMDIFANVSFIEESHAKQWTSPEEAFEDQKWMFCDMTDAEEEKIKLYLDQNLRYQDGVYTLSYERKSRWAVMWWKKE